MNDHANDASSEPVGGAALQEFGQALAEGRAEDAQTAALNFLSQATRQATHRADQEPSQDLLLKLEAHRCEAVADWEGTELLLRQALALAEAQDHIFNIFTAHHDLSRLYTFLGHDQAALEESVLAISVARRSKLGPTMASLLRLELVRQAQCALLLGDALAALQAVAEMLEEVSNQPIPLMPLHSTPRALGLIVRAGCEIELGQTAAAEDDLAVAWSLLAPRAPALIFAAVHMALADWWETTARLRTMQENTAGAIVALQEAVERRRHVASLPQLDGPYKHKELSDALDDLGQALHKTEQTALAAEAFFERDGIRQAIGLPIPGTPGSHELL